MYAQVSLSNFSTLSTIFILTTLSTFCYIMIVMPLTRREFLSKLATIAVVTPILPKLLENIAPPDPINEVTTEFTAPKLADEIFKDTPLTLQILEDAFQQLAFGYDEPDMIMMSPDTYSDFMQEWVRLPTAVRFQRESGELELPYFNGASVTHCNSLPKGSWLEINSKTIHGSDPNYINRTSGLFTKAEPKWHPIPKEL